MIILFFSSVTIITVLEKKCILKDGLSPLSAIVQVEQHGDDSIGFWSVTTSHIPIGISQTRCGRNRINMILERLSIFVYGELGWFEVRHTYWCDMHMPQGARDHICNTIEPWKLLRMYPYGFTRSV